MEEVRMSFSLKGSTSFGWHTLEIQYENST